jgi:hypothetical protein
MPEPRPRKWMVERLQPTLSRQATNAVCLFWSQFLECGDLCSIGYSQPDAQPPPTRSAPAKQATMSSTSPRDVSFCIEIQANYRLGRFCVLALQSDTKLRRFLAMPRNGDRLNCILSTCSALSAIGQQASRKRAGRRMGARGSS